MCYFVHCQPFQLLLYRIDDEYILPTRKGVSPTKVTKEASVFRYLQLNDLIPPSPNKNFINDPRC